MGSIATLTPLALSVGQSTSINGVSGEFSLSGVHSGQAAQLYASFDSGRLNSGQGMIAGDSVYTSQDTSLVANIGTVSSQASVNGNQAVTGLQHMTNPALNTIQIASAAGGLAQTGQAALIVADGGYTGSSADGSNGAHSDVGLNLNDGFALMTQYSMAGEGYVPTSNLICLTAGGSIDFDAQSRYPSPGFGYLSYGSAVGPGDKIPVTEGKESWAYNLKNTWPSIQNDLENLRQQLDKTLETTKNPSEQVPPTIPYFNPCYEGPLSTYVINGYEVEEYPDGSLNVNIDGIFITLPPGIGDQNQCFKATGSSGCIQADLGNVKNAIILEPMYTAFTKVAENPSESDAPYETDGDAVFRYLVDSGYATWRYEDTAATKEHFQELNKFDFALIDSHMNSYAIALSTPSENPDEGQLVYASDIKNWYTNPLDDSFVVLNGCKSVGPNWPDIDDASLLGSFINNGGSLVGGFPGTAYTGWSMDSVSEFFKYMYENPGSDAIDANIHVNWDYRTDWEARHYTGPYVQPLCLMGKDWDALHWTLK